MKDPAIIWYWNDWGGGTRTFSRHLKGCYIDLLEAQFNSGPLSLEEIKTVLGVDFAVWGTLSKKFKHDEKSGLFFNERMEVEKAKRKGFSNKQKERVLKRWNKSGNSSGNTTVLPKKENRNRNKNRIKNESINISFDLFWNAYDKKIGEKKKLTAKWNTLTDCERDAAMKYIPLYLQSQPDKKFRKNPETFLNNHSWNDEIIISSSKEYIPNVF